MKRKTKQPETNKTPTPHEAALTHDQLAGLVTAAVGAPETAGLVWRVEKKDDALRLVGVTVKWEVEG